MVDGTPASLASSENTADSLTARNVSVTMGLVRGSSAAAMKGGGVAGKKRGSHICIPCAFYLLGGGHLF